MAQAAEARRRLAAGAAFDLVVTSDLQRARRTGELVAGGGSVPHVVDPVLREFDVGSWSGLTRAEIDTSWPDEIGLFDAGKLDAPPGGETRKAFDRRVALAAATVADLIAGHRSQRALVVTHGGVVRALARLQGLGDRHVSQLCGYRGQAGEREVTLTGFVDLLGVPRRGAAPDALAL